MEFEDDAFVLSARPHGDTGVVADLLTERHGRRLTYVAGGASRRMKPFLQPGSRVRAAFRSRDDSQLGSARLEPRGEDISQLFDSPLALAGLAAATAVVQGALPEREPEPGIFAALEALMSAFAHDAVWPAVFIRFELGLLASLGFGLNLDVCAVSGATDDLAWVSPRTGRAVSRTEGAPYADRLLGLPPFLLGHQAAVVEGDVGMGLALTGHFLEAWVFHPRDKPLPPARDWMVERLQRSGLL
jgi:DNA repair protein RecO (recombination protein O)